MIIPEFLCKTLKLSYHWSYHIWNTHIGISSFFPVPYWFWVDIAILNWNIDEQMSWSYRIKDESIPPLYSSIKLANQSKGTRQSTNIIPAGMIPAYGTWKQAYRYTSHQGPNRPETFAGGGLDKAHQNIFKKFRIKNMILRFSYAL